jgi:putative transposase
MVSGPKPPVVQLTDAERQELEKLVKRHATEQQIALRARIVLATAAGESNAQIGRELQITVDTARL